MKRWEKTVQEDTPISGMGAGKKLEKNPNQ
jgi:hypothetical protein